MSHLVKTKHPMTVYKNVMRFVDQIIGKHKPYLPKGIDLSIYSQKDLDKIADRLNNRPRKVLGFSSPMEVYQTEISNQSVALQN